MEKKLNIPDLAEGLSRRTKLPRRIAETFVRQFFDTLEENLLRENIVKVKGLGTFKLIDVEARESVNIQTGGRFQIAGHTKISFTPDAVLRDAVNKPFAEFETVVLNENTDVSLMEAVEDFQPLPVAEEPQEEEPLQEDPAAEEQIEEGTITEEPVAETVIVEETAVKDSVCKEPSVEKPDTEEQTENEPIAPLHVTPVEPKPEMKTATSEPPHHLGFWHVVMMLFTGIILLVLGYGIGYLRPLALPFLDRQTSEIKSDVQHPNQRTLQKGTSSKAVAAPAKTSSKPTSDSQDMPSKDLQVVSTEGKGNEPAKKMPSEVLAYPQLEGGDYLIVGIKGTEVMAPGKTLLNISIKYYKSQDFVPYICTLNDIKNPDIVPLNKELKIPELKHK
ncbi:MAG: HU family DNA-binding protein [Bacteroidaceae bacterium]|nr:HU family DNA-binding protein [Bacteroidaceae bacterium]